MKDFSDNPGLARLSFVNIFEDSLNQRSTLRIYHTSATRLLHERHKSETSKTF